MSSVSRNPGHFRKGNRAAAKPPDAKLEAIALRVPKDCAAKLRRESRPGLSQGAIVAALVQRWNPAETPLAPP